MKFLLATLVGALSLLNPCASFAQQGGMMNDGGWGGGWMNGYGGAGGYGGMWLPVLLVIVIVRLIAWIVAQKKK